MGLELRKPVFMVSDKVRLKPACSATETRWYNTFQKVNNNGTDLQAGLAFVSQVFSSQSPYICPYFVYIMPAAKALV